MSGWSDIQQEISAFPTPQDATREKYLHTVYEYTGRNAVAYYSGWLMPGPNGLPFGIDDSDMAGFMSAFQGLDRTKGLDLLLHTPGGDVAATEAIIKYIAQMFDDVRVIVPQLAMSGGTMIALSANRIAMGKHSSLGPIDPQFSGVPAGAILGDFKSALAAVKADPSSAPLYQQLISKYPPAILGQCEKVIVWANEIASESLKLRMFANDKDAESKTKKVVDVLGSHETTLNHGRHYSIGQVRGLGLQVEVLEDDQDFQDAILSYHHAAMISFAQTPAFKITENHAGKRVIFACLLYTSPSPRDRQKSRMPSSA